jgi:hypothetical protein
VHPLQVEAVRDGPSGTGTHEAVDRVDLPSVLATTRVPVVGARRFLGDGA